MPASVDLFLKLAVTIIKLIVAFHPELKNNAIVAEILAAIDTLHISAMQPPH